MQKEIMIYGLIALLILWIYIEQRLLMTKKYRVKSDRLLPAHKQTGFVLLADLHNRTFGAENHRLIKRIDSLHPDFIVVAGDIINKKAASCPGNAYTLLNKLSDKYKIIYAYGNHEQRMEQFGKTSVTELTKEEQYFYQSWIEFKNKLSKKGVIFLDNESTILEWNGVKLRFTGVSIGTEYFGFHTKEEMSPEYLPSLLGQSTDKEYQLLIAHNPVYVKNYAEWGADLILSGHLHGGMMRLPGIGGVLSPQAKFFPKYDSGMHEYMNSQLIVSRGLGSHSIMPRIFNIPELVYVELVCDSSTNE
jgi:predicted MPP superfamily phosphohydrolase